jgi:hypothetical protein
MANRIGHAPQYPDGAIGGRYSDKPGNPTHDKECGMARLALNLDNSQAKSDKIGIGGMGEWLKPAVLKSDQALSASFSKFNITSVQPAVYSHSDLHS